MTNFLARSMPRRRALAVMGALACAAVLPGCVDQHPERADGSDQPRIVATSPAVAEICEKLDLDLVGIPATDRGLPDRYQGLTEVGTPMAPDLEILKSLRPDYVISPNSLQTDLQPQYEGAGLACIFVDLKSVDGLYDSLVYLGDKFGKREAASALVDEYHAYLEEYRASVNADAEPSVLILMGVPGSYIVATENSYAGSLVALAGGKNVYAGEQADFVNVNTEDMLARDPDMILRTAHALPDQVMEMFAEEFESNDIWRHFRAVEEGRVFDLDASKFGMSAEFNYPEALEDLKGILYGE